MKTPDEIKKGLECRARAYNGTCQYACSSCDVYVDGRLSEVFRNAIVLIQHLETRLAQAERERDAAVHDITNSAPCFACWHFIRNSGACKGGMRCCDEQFRAEIGATEYDGPEWKWRGVCAENTKGESK